MSDSLDTGQIDRLNAEAWALRYTDLPRAQQLADEAFKDAERGEPPYARGMAQGLRTLSWAQQRVGGYDAALALALHALQLFRTLQDPAGQAAVLNIIGGTTLWVGNPVDALDYHMQAARLAQKAGDAALESESVNLCGVVYAALNEPSQALDHYQRAQQLALGAPDAILFADALSNASSVYSTQGDLELALGCAFESVTLYQDIGFRQGEVEALASIGDIYERLDDHANALHYFRLALDSANATAYARKIITALLAIGRVHTRLGDRLAALHFLQDAHARADAQHEKHLLSECCHLLYGVYKQMGDYEKALAQLEKHYQLRAEVFDERADLRLKTLQLIHDVQHVRMESELHQLKNVELKQEIAERERLIGDLNAYAHTVAHDLQTPTATINSYAELLLLELQDKPLAPVVMECAAGIVRTSKKMENIIRELLLLAGIREQNVTTAALDMAAVVREALARLAPMIEEYHAEIVQPTAWTPAAVGYAPWVEEVWVNYLSNAMKYGGTPPRIELGVTAEGDSVRFWVQDNGAGLSADALGRLFTAFTRLDETRARGTGLGLSIVKRIVEKLGGTVSAVSAGVPGQGSRFSFALPGLRSS